MAVCMENNGELPFQDFKGKGRKIKIFASYYRPHKKIFFTDMICALIIAAVNLLFPVLSGLALNNFLTGSQYREFFACMGILVVGYILRAGMQYYVSTWGHVLGVRMEADMRRDLFAHLQKMPFSFYDKNKTGALMSRIVNDLFETVELAHHGPEDVFISTLTFIGSFIAMMLIQWKLALVLVFIVPLIILFTAILRKRMARASREVKVKVAEINTELENSLSGIRVAKAFANEAYEMEKVESCNQSYKEAKQDYYRYMGSFQTGYGFLTAMLNLICICIGGFLVMQDQMQIGELLSFVLYINAFMPHINQLASFMEQFTVGMAGFSRFVDLMDTPTSIFNHPDAHPLSDVKGQIRYENVTFSYDEGSGNVLSGIDLTIEPGQTVALVGPSGGGKTTMCQLIPRFYDVTSGKIYIDGQEIHELTLHSLRENIGIVQQDVFIFGGTIRENIRYGRIEASDAEIIQAAKMAEIHDFIMSLPDGYDTYVGERGVRLSGGQKQRLSIARVFLKNPKIIILDEATSALDTETEIKIQNALDTLAKGRTTLVIAHRLSTIKNADRILVIGNEGILESGTHAELLAQNGEYAKLYQAQFQLT